MEGQSVPADARVICDYSNPEDGWKEFKRLEELGELVEHSGRESDEDEDIGEHQPQKRYALLACDHSAITGESLAVDRYIGDKVFYTTGCKRGKAFAVVQATGKETFVGRTAAMVQSAEDTGHFKMVMNSIGSSLLVIVMAWILAAWIGGFFRNIPIASPREQALLWYTLDLLIIGVPVGLPVVTTTTMAVGAAYLAKRKAIVQKLTAIESLSVCRTGHAMPPDPLLTLAAGSRHPLLRQNRDVDGQPTERP